MQRTSVGQSSNHYSGTRTSREQEAGFEYGKDGETFRVLENTPWNNLLKRTSCSSRMTRKVIAYAVEPIVAAIDERIDCEILRVQEAASSKIDCLALTDFSSFLTFFGERLRYR